VLSYVGVGVDPSMHSFGGMINLARNEMSRDPVVWWSFAAAFAFMVTLVLAANLFADGVRDAFDPRARGFAGRLTAQVRASACWPSTTARRTRRRRRRGARASTARPEHRARRDLRAGRRVGCGKSMTALALMRLLPDNGDITEAASVCGASDVLELPERDAPRARRRIGMIFQEPATSLNPVMRIGDQIVEAIETHTALRGGAARAKAIDWLRRVGIPEPERRIDDYPFRMSGGQKQRVMIAMTLAAEPDFLVADEPTTALDVTIQAQILELLKDLQREQRMGMLLITHDLAVVAGMAQRVALMYAGQIVEVAPAATSSRARAPVCAGAAARAARCGRRAQPLEAIAGTVPPLSTVFEGCRFAPRCALAMPACATHRRPLFDADAPSARCVACCMRPVGRAA
jgi:ABC-type dipeptide/oligopeptide/nickel transport system ATPase component